MFLGEARSMGKLLNFLIEYLINSINYFSYSRVGVYEFFLPRNSSATTHPRDHISMASQNGRPRMISGAR